jgi:hypothetical protein
LLLLLLLLQKTLFHPFNAVGVRARLAERGEVAWIVDLWRILTVLLPRDAWSALSSVTLVAVLAIVALLARLTLLTLLTWLTVLARLTRLTGLAVFARFAWLALLAWTTAAAAVGRCAALLAVVLARRTATVLLLASSSGPAGTAFAARSAAWAASAQSTAPSVVEVKVNVQDLLLLALVLAALVLLRRQRHVQFLVQLYHVVPFVVLALARLSQVVLRL